MIQQNSNLQNSSLQKVKGAKMWDLYQYFLTPN